MGDRYRHWYEDMGFQAPAARPMRMAPRVQYLEDQVLQDLAKAETDAERLEIIDSYSLASQRKYRGELYRTIMVIAQDLFVKLLGPTIELNLPAPQAPYHPIVGKVVPTEF